MILIKNNNSIKLQNAIHKELRSYNRRHCKWIYDNENEIPSSDEKKYNNFIVYDDEILIGGAIGFIEYEWYYISMKNIEEME